VVTSCSPLLLLVIDTTSKASLVRTPDVVPIGKTPTAQLVMFVCAERVYGIATAYAFVDATLLIWLSCSVQVSEFHEGFDVKL